MLRNQGQFVAGEVLKKRFKPLLFILGLTLLGLVVVIDFAAPWELATDDLYLVPISFFSWFFSRRTATLSAIVCLVAWAAITHGQRAGNLSLHIFLSNAVINLALYLIAVEAFQKIRALYTREWDLSRKDALTGVANRRAFLEAVNTEIVRSRRYTLETTLVYLDIDDFKRINDSHGHKAGDGLLILVAQTLQNNLRASDLPSRLGGDEYAVLMPQTDADSASSVLRKLQRALQSDMVEHHWAVTFSIGAVTFSAPADSADEMLQQADRAMYSAKSAGKDRIVQAVRPIHHPLRIHRA